MQGANQGQDRTDNNEWKLYDTGGVGIEDLMAKKTKEDEMMMTQNPRLFLKIKTPKNFKKNEKYKRSMFYTTSWLTNAYT